MPGCCHVWLWFIEFTGVVQSRFTLSRQTIFTKISPITSEGSFNPLLTVILYSMPLVRKLVNKVRPVYGFKEKIFVAVGTSSCLWNWYLQSHSEFEDDRVTSFGIRKFYPGLYHSINLTADSETDQNTQKVRKGFFCLFLFLN